MFICAKNVFTFTSPPKLSPPMKNQRAKKFWRKVLVLFCIYLFIAPIVYFLLDAKTASADFRKDPGMFILKMTGIALGISLIINLWFRQDKRLRSW